MPEPIFEEAIKILPEGWRFSHLMALDDNTYQALLVSEEYCVSATGVNPFDAVIAAVIKTSDYKSFMALYKPGDHTFDDTKPTIDIGAALRNFTASHSKPFKRRI